MILIVEMKYKARNVQLHLLQQHTSFESGRFLILALDGSS
jgi:hypothetical protein